MLNPEDCRDRARSYQRLAMEVTEGEGKDHFFALAQSWDRLAADLESALGFIDTMDAVRRTSSKAA
ncbi:MAG: hypothetical protein WA717_11245 [Methyloceanibacter sp.]|jgi:hypothetical protein